MPLPLAGQGSKANPSIQIRAIPTLQESMLGLMTAIETSQSLHTDQGNSDIIFTSLEVLYSRVLVSIPPYRSGQLRPNHRPNGPGDFSPGLRPEADALGKRRHLIIAA